jgi:hypothetical protein
MPAGVFSPYAKQGKVVNTRYDMLSMIRSIELVLGMRPLGLPDRVATPMYDAFQSRPSNSAPFNVISPRYPLLERNANSATNRDLSRRYDFTHTDRVPQDVFDRLLWRSVHGRQSQPPPPGPRAARGQ